MQNKSVNKISNGAEKRSKKELLTGRKNLVLQCLCKRICPYSFSEELMINFNRKINTD